MAQKRGETEEVTLQKEIFSYILKTFTETKKKSFLKEIKCGV